MQHLAIAAVFLTLAYFDTSGASAATFESSQRPPPCLFKTCEPSQNPYSCCKGTTCNTFPLVNSIDGNLSVPAIVIHNRVYILIFPP
ncbi:hypothetical protein C8Q79DRAFT_280698 [Trametes meyenii]|nr:hypothetical protein C8Q79DRAFT_280698 [Trametes meyenii]